MSDSIIPVKVILKNEAGKEIANVVIQVPGSKKFDNLSAGKYTVTCIPPSGYKYISPNPSYQTITGSAGGFELRIGLQNVNSISTPPNEKEKPPKTSKKEESLNPSIGTITLAAIGMTILGNVSTSANLSSLAPDRSSTEKQAQSSPQKTSVVRKENIEGQRSPEVDVKLKECIQGNIQRLSGIPSLSGLLEYLSNEENSSVEFRMKIIPLYKNIEELYATIDECDPTMIQKLLDLENQKISDKKITIVGAAIVNVRSDSNLEAKVIEHLTEGNTVHSDEQSFTNLSQQQKSLIANGVGWYPVILLDNRKGYIYSRYIKE
jgi:hypothetical protein